MTLADAAKSVDAATMNELRTGAVEFGEGMLVQLTRIIDEVECFQS